VHRSRLVGILIDTPAAQVDAVVDFWSAALGAHPYPVPGEEQFAVLIDAAPGLFTVVQAVDDAPRYHVDIETDDFGGGSCPPDSAGRGVGEPLEGRLHAALTKRPLLCVVPCTASPRRLPSQREPWP
jgi:hypothetical protein